MREPAFAEVIDGLQQRSAAILIVGLGGNGKTSLAREVAAHCLQEETTTPRFDAAVWVSDKDRPGTTNLSVVLDEIARTLDYPGFTQFAYDEKRYEVEQLLKKQRVLLVIDNFETITDGALLTWLLRLPEPSKALITSREYGREYRRGGWPVELRGMSGEEAQALVIQRLRVLRLSPFASAQIHLEALLAATGGNPKAIEIALGLVKYERRTLQEVVDDLYAARGDLFDDLFARAWALLDEAARHVLMVMTFFPHSAAVAALAAGADVQGFALDRAIERLVDLALIDVQQTDLNAPPRYTQHPLVRAFAKAKCDAQPLFAEAARRRWIGWYTALTRPVGSCWNNLGRLNTLDSERKTIFSVIRWSLDHGYYAQVCDLARGVRYYYYVRGYWDKRLQIDLWHAEAARQMHDPIEEIKALAYYVQIVARQDRLKEAEGYLPRLQSFVVEPDAPAGVRSICQQALALYAMAERDFATAAQLWQASERRSDPRVYVAARRWRAQCLAALGQLDEAQQLFAESLQDAIAHGYERSVALHYAKVALINLAQGANDAARHALEQSSAWVARYSFSGDIGEVQYIAACIAQQEGLAQQARSNLLDAADRFERMGLRRELAEARTRLAVIEGQLAA
ncbi:hypothetical protein SE17_16270 [Kouleothrix aurantiaca]|uniref:NB-ARC domain-containing protein n=1 Tax=Kouleothrix aurantiaca TaxID=186479 RepID=A0A0P9DG88_9CHLR|nr:hypothetical protein SE17_16270 [Kouleothrix aurantiaca]